MSSPFIIHQDSPRNAEPQLAALLDHFYTPMSLAFRRNHSKVEAVSNWNLRVGVEESLVAALEVADRLCEGPEQEEMSNVGRRDVSQEVTAGRDLVIWLGDIDALKGMGQERSLRACLPCAGLRRDELTMVRETEGVQWSSSAIANLLWKGIPLRTLLVALGFPTTSEGRDTSQLHIHFESDVGPCEEDEWFGSSLSYDRIMSPDAAPFILAYGVNGVDLPSTHGGPLRIVTPGIIGARSVKFLERIAVRSFPSVNFYETSDYKRLPSTLTAPSKTEKAAAMAKEAPIEEYGMNLVIGPISVLESHDQNGLRWKKVKVRGYALGSHGIPIAQVLVTFVPTVALSRPPTGSLNDVRSLAATHPAGLWTAASLDRGPAADGDDEREWGWILWETTLEVESNKSAPGSGLGMGWIVGKAVDKEGHEQRREGLWNVRGVAMEGWSVGEV